MSPNISGPDKKENIPLGLISFKFSDRDIYPHTKEKYRAWGNHAAWIFTAISTNIPITTFTMLITNSTINASTVMTKISCSKHLL